MTVLPPKSPKALAFTFLHLAKDSVEQVSVHSLAFTAYENLHAAFIVYNAIMKVAGERRRRVEQTTVIISAKAGEENNQSNI